MSIHVVLVDDQNLVRSGIRGLLNLTPDIRVVAEAADGVAALAVLEQCRQSAIVVDVLLLDIRMPVCSGLQLLHTQQGKLPPTILLTTFDDDDALMEGMKSGAKGYLLKDISLERLAEGIRSVANGATLFRPALTERARTSLSKQLHTMPAAAPVSLDRLTKRETEILALMAAGLSNAEIASALGPSEGTIKNHVSSILAKLGVRDRMRAVLRGLELSYI
ncbi:response regulator [Undibacterium sp. Ren11W]|uniref:response regulator n=1 Tax=Undibacterium sp. Ren11W TaxID=3413045 RepID=UPI003BF225C4